jgi:hypothetical protein
VSHAPRQDLMKGLVWQNRAQGSGGLLGDRQFYRSSTYMGFEE